MANLEHTVVAPNVGDGLLARLDALNEVLGMVLANLAPVDFFDGAIRKLSLIHI